MSKPVALFLQAGVLGICCAGFALVQTSTAQQPSPDQTPTADSPTPSDALGANDTEILANQGATFAAKDRVAVFSGDVRVRDPRFNLACDKLTVYLAKGAVPDAGTSTSAPAATATPPPIKNQGTDPRDAGRGGGGIDHAVAEGHVVIVQKRPPAKPGEEEKISVGRAETVEYNNETGELTMRGLPRIEQNGNYTEALSRSTYMILGRDNSLKTIGPSKTKIIQNAKDTDGPSGGKPGGKAGNAVPPARRGQTNAPQG